MTDKGAADSPRGLGLSLLTVLGTLVFVSLFLGIYTLLGVGVPYIGLLFLLYWAAIRHQDFAEYLPSLVGGLIGLAVGWCLISLPQIYGVAGGLVAYGMLCGVLFFFLRRQAKLIGNHCTLMFMLVATIPDLNVRRNIVEMLESLVLAAVLMGLVSLGLNALGRRRAARRLERA